jgi:hypothetical protein
MSTISIADVTAVGIGPPQQGGPLGTGLLRAVATPLAGKWSTSFTILPQPGLRRAATPPAFIAHVRATATNAATGGDVR